MILTGIEMLTKEKVTKKENVLISRITLRVIPGYVTLDYITIIKRKLIFVIPWSDRG